jgi:hypothetical protein
LGAVALVVAVLGLEMLALRQLNRRVQRPLALKPESKEAKLAAHRFFEPPKGQERAIPPEFLPSALARFDEELAAKLALVRRKPVAGRGVMLEMINCVSQERFPPPSDQAKCLLLASQVAALFPRDRHFKQDFERALGLANPQARQRYELSTNPRRR